MFRPLPRLLLASLLLFTLALDSGVNAAWARASSSGGYSRPSTSSPSGGYRAPTTAAPSARSGSGGYTAPPRRPSTGYTSAPASGGDAAISRQSSGQALQDYRASQAKPPPPPPIPVIVDRRPPVSNGAWTATRPAPSPGSTQATTQWAPQSQSGSTGGGWFDGTAQRRPPPQPYAPPAYGWAQPGRTFGVWDGLMLWGVLHSLSTPGNADFFHNNQNTPAYKQWRAEAERTADTDPAVKTRLDELDRRLAEMRGQPQTPGAPPPAAASPAKGGHMTLIIVLALAIAAFLALWYWRRQAANPGPGALAPEALATASPNTAKGTAALKGSTHSRFRVGMTLPVDPTPFILAGGATKIKPIDGSGMISVEAVGVLMDGAIALNRLYLPGRESFFQLHLGADGKPDECRYFSHIDQIAPASQDEWAAWLDPAQGMIGWPQFQTKDGKLYNRVWAPGDARIEPRAMDETVQDLTGTSTRKLGAMLYAGPTGAPPPAPDNEYILVTIVDMGGQAWVDIHAGIDINPSTLTLPSVALS